jgi:hypothetical protein
MNFNPFNHLAKKRCLLWDKVSKVGLFFLNGSHAYYPILVVPNKAYLVKRWHVTWRIKL